MREAALLERAGGGDLSAFREIVESHQRQIFCLVQEVTGNPEDAEDIMQEVFIKAYRALPSFRGEAMLGSWLYRIAINTCMDRGRLRRKQRLRSHFPLEDAVGIQTHRAEDNPGRVQEAGAIRRDIEAAIEALTPLERTIFVLRHFRELKIREIAEVLERREGTVKNLLFRAVRKLRSRLADYRPCQSVEELQ